ncbi:ComEA family DNA-binding protein [Pseudoalteromonas phenolica]|uniref:Competence protein n=1 Tax=Pseudoalteromonas phenolica TaxID=161398 RepID=A0A0S2K3I9_9GAMM|nr:ComEA family DNA-binding protein [Pseudoalteromonas phenolica]ALO43063.1 Competence protein [Pseudoalteromonas phenolica]MBE0355787.1 competence protein ComEA [Pseudoalteromonas phenolica O-BC30]RXF03925.1 ComEA family DNA-binding protein [Pseudoalteromonas phenolica O-BC30]
MIKALLLATSLFTAPTVLAEFPQQQTSPETQPQTQSAININEASLEELVKLPGIGKGKARAIVSFREQNGPFDNLDSLMAVKGVGRSIVAKLEGKVKF